MILQTDVFGDLTHGATPIVVLHGLFGSGTNWRTLARRFSSRLPVVTLDARNHGKSPHADTMSYAEMAGDVEDSLTAIGVGTAHVLGHSMGGKTAMMLALTSPERVSSLVVADIAPVAYTRGLGPELKLMQQLPLASLKRRADADAALRDDLPEPGLRAFLLQNLELGPSGPRWRLNLEAIERAGSMLTGFSPPENASYTGPVRFIRGGRSDYLTPHHEETVSARFPGAKLQTIQDAGHWLHAEQPDEFERLVVAHLEARH